MRLEKMEVNNFRLLKNFSLDFKDYLSLIIGKNNCGKTSVLMLLDKMINLVSSKGLVWEDISLDKQQEIYHAVLGNNLEYNINEERCEVCKLTLYIKYNENDSYENIRYLMMDLAPENDVVIIEFLCYITNQNIKNICETLKEKGIQEFKDFSKYMSKNFKKLLEYTKYAKAYDYNEKIAGKEISGEIDVKVLKRIIKFTGIMADRPVSNKDGNKTLSSLSEAYYRNKSGIEQSENIIEDLEKTILDTDKKLFEIYNGCQTDKKGQGIFSDIIDVIRKYGGTQEEIDIAIESNISKDELMRNHTQLSYKQGENCFLPENYNGLGYLNLIGILFEIENNIQKILEDPSDINVLYIEEPEAHTHPQLQSIFIQNIKNHIDKYRAVLDEKGKKLQVIITSHSSHIVAQCDFNDIIYMRKIENNIMAKSFQLLRHEYENNKLLDFKFVKQFLTIQRSELFFADKVICIEGDTERILMPAMMYKLDQEMVEGNIEIKSLPLLSQNISIIETGAYSHVFMPLFDFLGTKVLIITDLDSVDNNGKTCRVSVGIGTSNQSIINFFADFNLKAEKNQIKALQAYNTDEKIRDRIRIAYQIPEPKDEDHYTARSFEDAFIALNKDFILKFGNNIHEYGGLKKFKKNELSDVFKFAQTRIEKKSSFASSLLYYDNNDDVDSSESTWSVPFYIREGLIWLRDC